MSFVHLHLHTEYSMLDGLNRTYSLMEKVKNANMPAVAITDHGVMYGVTEFWLGAKEFGVKPIIGCEIYLAPGKHTVRKEIDGLRYYHLLLLAQNKTGYLNLNKIVSIAQLEGMYYRPRIDAETLAKYSEGLICTSACLAGPLCTHILNKDEKKLNYWLDYFEKNFPGRFYLEIQRNGFHNTDEWNNELTAVIPQAHIQTVKEQMIVNTRLKEISAERKLPLITTTDAHFLNKDDALTQEVLFAIKDGRKLTDVERRIGYLDTYVKSPEEMRAHFEDMPEVIDQTNQLAESIEEFEITFDRVQPRYIAIDKAEAKLSPQALLKQRTYEGAKEMYGDVSKELTERIEYELQIIHDKGYNDYFLVVADIINWARNQGIVVGVRGSVAGSVVAYCLDIINVEPLWWELYFERFLNPDRPSPPDIDMDFQDDRRDEVVKYVEEKYGKENVAAICAIGRMKTKAAIRDVARVMDIDLKVADKLSKMVHVIFGKVKPIEKMMKDDPEFAVIINSDPKLQKLKDTVSKIEGMARHVSTHACGYLITPDEITNYVSVQLESGKGSEKVITQQEGVWIETLGLMKFDFLGLRNLTIIKNTLDLIKRYHGVELSTKTIPLDDKETFALFSRGETIGVFQFESPPMQKYLRSLQPDSMEDICFMVSAYRPGPMKYIPDYIDCRHGRKKPEYLIPEMEAILKNTYGFAIYQEQVIKIAVDIAGYSMGNADLLRRAMGKKKIDIMNKEAPIFKKGVMEKGYNQEIADQIWEYLLPFADYGFNKAHGASYAVVAYWCAYLKAHYPIEFMTGLMHSDIEDSERISIDMKEARKMDFTILPPDINKSSTYFTIEKGSYIRFGLGAVKNVGLNLVEEIVKEREANGEFTSFDDFVTRILPHKMNKKALDCLIKIGAFDKFGQRNQFLAIAEEVYEIAHKRIKSIAIGQVDIFGSMTEETANLNKTELPELHDLEDKQKIAWEKELLGTYITAHPLDNYRMHLSSNEIHDLTQLCNVTTVKETNYKADQKYKFLCLIAEVKNVLTKRDSKPMALLKLEDQNGTVEAVIFPKAFEQIRNKIATGEVCLIFAQVSENNDKLNLIIEDIYHADSMSLPENIKIDITETYSKNELQLLKEKIKTFRGEDVSLSIVYGNGSDPKEIRTKVKAAPELFNFLNPYIKK